MQAQPRNTGLRVTSRKYGLPAAEVVLFAAGIFGGISIRMGMRSGHPSASILLILFTPFEPLA